MIVVSSTRGCVRTPVALLALEEAGAPYTLEIKEDGWFERTYGEAGPSIEATGWAARGLEGIERLLTRLPGATAGPEDAAAMRDWAARLGAMRPVFARIGAARRQGATPTSEDLGALGAFLGALDTALAGREWLGTAGPCGADFVLVPVARMARSGVPLPPRVAAWSDRMRARPAWARVCAAFPAAAA